MCTTFYIIIPQILEISINILFCLFSWYMPLDFLQKHFRELFLMLLNPDISKMSIEPDLL